MTARSIRMLRTVSVVAATCLPARTAPAQQPTARIVSAAERFLATLDQPQRGRVLFRFDDDTTLHSHLRMDGSWHLYRPGQRWHGPAHQVRAVLDTGDRVVVGFRLHDLALLPTAEEHRVIGHLGPDLLDPEWGPRHEDEAVRRLAADPDRAIGLALLDQSAVAGLGNLYRTELCFLLGVSPWTPVSGVDLRAAVRRGRELLRRNLFRPDQPTTGRSAPGTRHWVFERAGRPCRRCGRPVRGGARPVPGRRAARCG